VSALTDDTAQAQDTPGSLAAVLFDMDGLLVETESTWYTVETEVMARLGGTWTHEHQAAIVGSSLPRLAAYMTKVAGSDVPQETVRQWVLDGMVERLSSGPVAWRPGAEQLLRAVRAAGVPTALVSTSHRLLMEAVLRTIGSVALEGSPFDVTVAGDEVGHTKPHPEPYLTAAAALGVVPQRCVVLEDSANGARAGLAAGCRTVLVPSLSAVPPPDVAQSHGLVLVDSLERVDVARLRAIVAESLPSV
jgi:HAD superfamily hydrolase (TIGR01509 family)